MDSISKEVIFTAVIILSFLLLKLIAHRSIKRSFKRFQFSVQRRRITVKITDFFLLLGSIIGIVAIWGINSEKLVLFLSSVVTILGVAFFAQWSILSNVTAGLILFFNHPLKLGDQISVLEKDFIIEGTIEDITIFFLHVKTKTGENITMPNSIVLQKNIGVKPSAEKQ